ncbi:MAG: Lrp/AsnC family transcriptional regulator [Propioniciclava sp.]|uniref:Lrp/AsnC family transcriptional regulator n=1 Tax=Propioniciclava sp. TaxID=2038686 RepID=UPI0039E6D3EC
MRDAIDTQILAELAANARIPLATLGERVRLSRNAVRLRIERMERDGVIQGYTVVRGRSGEDDRVAAMLFVYRVDRMRGADVLAALAKIPEIKTCDILTGEFDLLARIEARSVERVQEIWDSVSRLPGVQNTITSISLSTTIDRG